MGMSQQQQRSTLQNPLFFLVFQRRSPCFTTTLPTLQPAPFWPCRIQHLQFTPGSGCRSVKFGAVPGAGRGASGGSFGRGDSQQHYTHDYPSDRGTGA